MPEKTEVVQRLIDAEARPIHEYLIPKTRYKTFLQRAQAFVSSNRVKSLEDVFVVSSMAEGGGESEKEREGRESRKLAYQAKNAPLFTYFFLSSDRAGSDSGCDEDRCVVIK